MSFEAKLDYGEARCPGVPCFINGNRAWTAIDTWASHSFISEEAMEEWGLSMVPGTLFVGMGAGGSVRSPGYCDLQVKLPKSDAPTHIKAWVLKDKAGAPLTLGADGQATMDVAVYMKSKTLRVDGHQYHFLRACDLPAWMDEEATTRLQAADEASRQGRFQRMAAESAGEGAVVTDPPAWATAVGPESPGGQSMGSDDQAVPLAAFYRMTSDEDLQHFLLVSPSPRFL